MEDLSRFICDIASSDPDTRENAARKLYRAGRDLADSVIQNWCCDPEIRALFVSQRARSSGESPSFSATVGVAVRPPRFEQIREANGNPALAEVPSDQDAREFELHVGDSVALDILTTRTGDEKGAIARFLARNGEGIQQIEYLTNDLDRAVELIRSRLNLNPIYPATRPGADGTRVNFFLANAPAYGKVLIELVEAKR